MTEAFVQNLVQGDVFEVVLDGVATPVRVNWAILVPAPKGLPHLSMRVGFDLPDSEGHITIMPCRAPIWLLEQGWRPGNVRNY